MLTFFLFLLGLVAGSFASVLSYRLPIHKVWAFDRSRCVSCNAPLSVFSLIPLFGFLIQKGRCSMCHSRISWRYPFLEVAMGLLFILSYHTFGWQILTVLGCCFVFFSLVLFMADLETFLLPLSPMVGIGILGVIRLLLDQKWQSHLYGLALGFSLFYLLKMISGFIYKREAMGNGDIILSAVIGLFLGFKGTVLFAYSSFLIGGICGVILLIATSKKKSDMVPFGPILIVAAYCAFFFGDKAWQVFLAII